MNVQEDLICPRCGKILSWSCHKETGTAFCEAYSSRVYQVVFESPPCDFQGPVRRLPSGAVVLDETRRRK